MHRRVVLAGSGHQSSAWPLRPARRNRTLVHMVGIVRPRYLHRNAAWAERGRSEATTTRKILAVTAGADLASASAGGARSDSNGNQQALTGLRPRLTLNREMQAI
jgi:hypothetical protein